MCDKGIRYLEYVWNVGCRNKILNIAKRAYHCNSVTVSIRPRGSCLTTKSELFNDHETLILFDA